MKLLFWKKKDPLVTPKEQSVSLICGILDRWNKSERDEIIKAVVARSLPEKHIKYRPNQKDAA